MIAPETELQIREVGEATTNTSIWLVDGLRRLLLASVGAVAMTYDEVQLLVTKLVERGGLAQKDAEKLLGELSSRLNQGRPQTEKIGSRMEQGMEDFLNRLNIPSKHDIDELSAKIAQLSVRVEELSKK